MFLYKHQSRFTEAHRGRLAEAFAHVEQARAVATDPAAASGPTVAAEPAARKRPHTSPEPKASTHAAAASGTTTLAPWRRLKAESHSPAERPSAQDVGLADPLSMPASSKPTGPKRAKRAASEPEAAPEEPEAEGAARKRPRQSEYTDRGSEYVDASIACLRSATLLMTSR